MPVSVIALGGIQMWRPASNRHALAGALRVFAKNRSAVQIVFDQPKKEQGEEFRQARQLGIHLKKCGAKATSHTVFLHSLGPQMMASPIALSSVGLSLANANGSLRYAADILNPEGTDPYAAAVTRGFINRRT